MGFYDFRRTLSQSLRTCKRKRLGRDRGQGHGLRGSAWLERGQVENELELDYSKLTDAELEMLMDIMTKADGIDLRL